MLNEDPRQSISPATRQRVREAAAALGYVRNARAAALRRDRSPLVLLALDALNAGVAGERVTEAVTTRLRDEGWIVVSHTHERADALLELAGEMAPEAVISLTFLTSQIRRQLQAAGVRRIVDMEVVENAGGPPDRPWEYPFGQLQVDHLAERGYRRLVYVLPAHSNRLPVARERLAGAQMECTVLGLNQPEVLHLPLERPAIVEALTSLNRGGDRIGLCAFSDEVGVGVMGAAHDLGWRIGEQVGVIGCDDVPVASLVTPALSSVAANERDFGIAAAEALLTLGDGDGRAHWVAPELDYRVIDRAST